MILDDTLDFLESRLSTIPRVKEMIINSGFSAVSLDTGHLGLAMNIRKGTAFSDSQIESFLGRQIGENAVTVARDFAVNRNEIVCSLRVALVNALSRPFLEDSSLLAAGYQAEVNPPEYLSDTVNKNQTAVMVGFGGMVRTIEKLAGKVYITELEPEIFKSTIISSRGIEKGPTSVSIIHADGAEEYFRSADVAYITGSTLVTNTMEDLLAQCTRAKTIVYGFSAGLVPEMLFQRGVDVIATSRVTNPQMMIDLLKNNAGVVERLFPLASESIVIKKPGAKGTLP